MSSQEDVTSQSSSDGQPPSKMPHYSAQADPPEDSKVVAWLKIWASNFNWVIFTNFSEISLAK